MESKDPGSAASILPNTLDIYTKKYYCAHMKSYYVYMMTNITNSTLYIGVSGSLEKRVNEHKQLANAFRDCREDKHFTEKYRCHKIVYYEKTNDIYEAIKREKQLKGWTRAKKDALVNMINPGWRDLAE